MTSIKLTVINPPLLNCYTKRNMSYTNRYSKTNQQAEIYKQKTLKDIEDLQLPANPIHYSLLYEKNCYQDPDLAREIDLLVTSKSYSEDSIQGIYNLYLKKQLNSTLPTENIKLLIDNSLNDITSWTTESSDSRANLHTNLGEISKCTTEQEVLECIRSNIMPPIERLDTATQELEKKLQEASDTIKALTEELEKATNMARTDALTGLPNRRGFNDILQCHIDQAIEESQTFAMLIIDIDYFKKINDDYGHLVGDSVLRYLARALQDLSKGKDTIARYGGEEFILLLADINYENAIRFADNLRKAIEKKKFNVQGKETKLSFTICIGVSLYQMGESSDALFERADKALYLAKESGRNQTRGEHQI